MEDEDKPTGCCGSCFNKYVDNAVRRPATMSCGILSGFIVLGLFAFAAFPLGEEFILLSEGEPKSWGGGPEMSDRENSLMLAQEDTYFNPNTNGSAVSATQTDIGYFLQFIYWKDEGANILEDDSMEVVRQVERRIMEHSHNGKRFSDLCWRDQQGNCSTISSFSKYLYATNNTGCAEPYASFNPNGLASTQTHGIASSLEHIVGSGPAVYCSPSAASCTASCEPKGPGSIDGFVAAGYDFNDTAAAKSFITRSTFVFGLPLVGYANKNDRKEEQIEVIEEFVVSLREINDAGIGENLGITYGAADFTLFIDYALNEVIPADITKMFVAIIIVWVLIWYNVQSLFLASFGMLHIIFSFILGYFLVTQLLLGIRESLPFVVILVPFLILGIGADDIFLFVDAWKQTEHTFKRSDFADDDEGEIAWRKKRFRAAYSRSAYAMLITSLTTAIAFMQLIASASLMGIRVFGVAAAATVLVDYAMVISYFPCAVMWWERDIRKLWVCCPGPGGQAGCCPPKVDHRVVEAAKAEQATEDIDQYRWMERFFYNTVGPMIHKLRWGTLAVFAIWTIAMIVVSTGLGASSEALEWLPEDDRYQAALSHGEKSFARAAESQQISFVHGVGIRTGSMHPFRPDEIGDVNFDRGFNPSTPGFQTAYAGFCDRVRGLRFVTNQEIFCPMDDFEAYLGTQNKSFPVPDEDFTTELAKYAGWFEAISGPAQDYGADRNAYAREFRRRMMAGSTDLIRFDRNTGELVAMITVANITGTSTQPANELRPQWEYFNGFMSAENANPEMQAASLGNGFQTSYRYILMFWEEDLVRLATNGIGTGLALAFIVISLATRSFELAFWTVFCIACAVASLTAAMVWSGWSLGIIEAIGVAIVVGLSVDYTLHFAIAWRSTVLRDADMSRLDRTKETLLEVGISVFWAAITTMVSAMAMVVCYVVFFRKFGSFILLTILFSTVFSFFMFMSMMAAFGPTAQRDDYKFIWGKITGKDDDYWRTAPVNAEGSTPKFMDADAVSKEKSDLSTK